MKPIGYFHARQERKFEAPRQPPLDSVQSDGEVRLLPGMNLEQALIELEGFSRLWLIFLFHKNEKWKPMVTPPRLERKVGVFATRSPHRPSGIGLSCVELVKIKGLSIFIRAHDLLNETPILDIKPYLPYSDSFPNSKAGWTDTVSNSQIWDVQFSPTAEGQIDFLQSHGVENLRGFLLQQLRENPLQVDRKRIQIRGPEHATIAYRTWRIDFKLIPDGFKIWIEAIRTGYSVDELRDIKSDKYEDKILHSEFISRCVKK